MPFTKKVEVEERSFLNSFGVVITIKRPLRHRVLFWLGTYIVRTGLFLMGVAGLEVEEEAAVTDCGHACGYVTLFAPEDGCPTHDPEPVHPYVCSSCGGAGRHAPGCPLPDWARHE